MTIERRIISHGQTVEITHLTPGSVEILSTPFWEEGEEVALHVDTDDDITISYTTMVRISDTKIRKTIREVVQLSKHTINDHTIQISPSLFRRRVTQYGWIPSRIHITPEQERAIQQLVRDGTYTEKDAEEVRDQMLFEKQREISGLDNTRK